MPVVAVIGLFTLAKFAAKAGGVFLQTFILPGTSVSDVKYFLNLIIDECFQFLVEEVQVSV